MKPVTSAQAALAAKLFTRMKEISERHHCPIKHNSYQEEMKWLELNPESRKDVSEYIGMYLEAKREARMTLGVL